MSQFSSQSSNISFPDLSLSQDTVHQLLEAVGMSGSDGNVLTNCYTAEYGDENEKIDKDGGEGSSSISIRKGVFRHLPYGGDNQRSYDGQSSQMLPSNNDPSPLLPNIHGIPSPLCQPSSSGLCDMESPLISSSNSVLPPLPELPSPPSISLEGGRAPTNSMPTIPLNTSLEGEYGFKIIPQVKGKRAVRSSNYIYSPAVQRAFIKQGITIPFYFSLTHLPPSDCVVRAMAIHTAPENIGDNLVCCPKHFDINQKQGLIFPLHFIRPGATDAMSAFHADKLSKRLSVTTPFSALQKHQDNQFSALYLFPCFTSDFSRTGQLVQIIFTLECGHDVLGRTTQDIRVCASPGRDYDVDEKRTRKDSPELNGKKRGASHLVSKCVLPPKKVCRLSNEKVKYTIETYPEIIPFVDVCVRMMEKVHHVPTTVTTGSHQGEEESKSQFDTLDGWLKHLGLTKYMKILQQNGISEPFQVLSISDEELKKWGMKTSSHRKKFLENKDLISPVLEDSPVLFSQSQSLSPPQQTFQQSQHSQSQSQSHTVNLFRSQSFEVVEITMQQHLSTASSSQQFH